MSTFTVDAARCDVGDQVSYDGGQRLHVGGADVALEQHDLGRRRLLDLPLELAGVGLDRKSLAELAVNHPAAFASVADRAKAAGAARTA